MKKNKSQKINGFTVTELVVGMGLSVIVLGVLMSVQFFLAKDEANMRIKLDESIDGYLAERILFKDLKSVEPSYNNLNILDDNSLNFFDFYPDIPAVAIKGRTDRVITMRSDKFIKSIIFTSQKVEAGSTMIYDPTAAYQISQSNDFNQAGALTFESLNYNNWISGVAHGNRSNFWKDNMILMLDTPSKLRPTGTNGMTDMSVAPRSPIYVGYVHGRALKPFKGTSIDNLFNLTEPDTGDVIDSEDTFLRKAPSVGGGQPLIRLKALNIFKYYLESNDSSPADCKESGSETMYHSSTLYRSIFNGSDFADPFVLADKVCALNFYRESVLKRIIYFKIVKVKDTQN